MSLAEPQDTGGRTQQLSQHPAMEGLLCQGKEFVFYLEDNGDLLKVFDLGNDMVKPVGMTRRLSALYWRKSPLAGLQYSPGREQKEDQLGLGMAE